MSFIFWQVEKIKGRMQSKMSGCSPFIRELVRATLAAVEAALFAVGETIAYSSVAFNKTA